MYSNKICTIKISIIQAFQVYKFYNCRPNISSKTTWKPYKNPKILVSVSLLLTIFSLKISLVSYVKSTVYFKPQNPRFIELIVTYLPYTFQSSSSNLKGTFWTYLFSWKFQHFGTIFWHICHWQCILGNFTHISSHDLHINGNVFFCLLILFHNVFQKQTYHPVSICTMVLLSELINKPIFILICIS